MSHVIEILQELNLLDEHPGLEAKKAGQALGTPFFETVCAFSNEPELGGGRIVLGIARSEEDPDSEYEVTGAADPDKLSADIATGCAEKFNLPVRPSVLTVEHEGKAVIVVDIAELSPSQKPLYFTKHGLPQGAYRRIGSADIRCTDDDLALFYGSRGHDSFDISIVKTASLRDIDPEAVDHYRKLGLKANPDAEAMQWPDEELLQAINAIRHDGDTMKPTLLGLLLFGTRMAYRRELPAVRVDYIRVPGKEWVSDPDKRFTSTIDMRGPLLQMVERAQAAILDDLPKGFDLKEGEIQAETPMLPGRVLREALVNALMHRSYREHRPTQIIRYSNRIEISNAGFSLKNEDQLGEPGSDLRNPNLAAVFFETNTAETKGSGIRVMREQMRAHGFSPPTFESDRAGNTFTGRFLLHHFLSDSDLKWLSGLEEQNLSESQKYALIFVREQGAVDNRTLRQLTGMEVLGASTELRKLRDLELLTKKGGGAATYYVPGAALPDCEHDTSGAEHDTLAPEHDTLDPELVSLAPEHVSLAEKHVSLGSEHTSLAPKHTSLAPEHTSLAPELPPQLVTELLTLGSRPGDRIRPLIKKICSERAFTAMELCSLLGRKHADRLKRDYLRPMVEARELELTFPDMERHPKQAYRTPKPTKSTDPQAPTA